MKADKDEMRWCGLVVLATRYVRLTKHIQTLQVSQVFTADSL